MSTGVECQGRLLKVTISDRDKRTGPVGGKRGRIKEFTPASRRRLIDLFNRLEVSKVRMVFMTLTFSGSPTPDEAQQALRRMRERLLRAYPNMSAVWRKEYQQRGAIHFHLVCFNLPFIKQSKLQEVWQECTGEAMSIVDIRLIRHSRMMMNYVAKYCAKDEWEDASTSLDVVAYLHGELLDSVGRYWGVWMRKQLPFAELLTFNCFLTDDLEYMVWCMKAVSGRRRGKRGKGLTFWGEEAAEWYWRAVLCCHVDDFCSTGISADYLAKVDAEEMLVQLDMFA